LLILFPSSSLFFGNSLGLDFGPTTVHSSPLPDLDL
jgi:hypothetical protein